MSDAKPDPTGDDLPVPRAETEAIDWSDLGGVMKRLGPAGPLAIIAATLPAIGGFVLLGMLPVVAPWLQALGMWGVVVYALAFAILAGLAILPTYAQAILGGWTFKFALGFPAALAGFVGGAVIGYLVATRATGDRVLQIIEQQPKWRAVYDALLRSGFWKTLLLITLIRIPLNSPFAITNLVMAATRVPPVAYIIGTAVGMAPRTAAAVWIAASLQELTMEGTKRWWMWVVSIVVTLVIVAIVGQVANRAIARVTAQTGETPASAG
jgi:uncharacterized membrane protein YdjX (TVP38/TMEM64 family)